MNDEEIRQVAESSGLGVPENIDELEARIKALVAKARGEATEEAVRAVLGEHLEDPQEETDAAYDMAIDHAAAAVRSLKG